MLLRRSKPETPGIMISSNTQSTGPSASAASASAPLRAERTAKPSTSRKSRISSTMPSSSSTTSTVCCSLIMRLSICLSLCLSPRSYRRFHALALLAIRLVCVPCVIAGHIRPDLSHASVRHPPGPFQALPHCSAAADPRYGFEEVLQQLFRKCSESHALFVQQ